MDDMDETVNQAANEATNASESDAVTETEAPYEVGRVYVAWNDTVMLTEPGFKAEPSVFSGRNTSQIASIDGDELILNGDREDAESLAADEDEADDMLRDIAEERQEDMARRIAALLNAARGMTTRDVEFIASSGIIPFLEATTELTQILVRWVTQSAAVDVRTVSPDPVSVYESRAVLEKVGVLVQRTAEAIGVTAQSSGQEASPCA